MCSFGRRFSYGFIQLGKCGHGGPLFVLSLSRYGTRRKVKVELDTSVISESQSKFKVKHSGSVEHKALCLPDRVREAVNAIMKDKSWKLQQEESEKFQRYLWGRHLPLEEAEKKHKISEAEQYVLNRYNVVDSSAFAEDQKLKDRYMRKVQKVMNQRTYAWKPFDYDNEKSNLYLVSRAAAEFSALHRILAEIKTRCPEFCPRTMLDFGSGVGSVTWATNDLWGESLREYFCVDSSSFMNDLASLILKGGNIEGEIPLKGVFYRQFLPSSDMLKYDLVISAYSLFEMPDLRTRLETVLSLWKKTQGYLVIVEQGTNSGFQVINEARDFILELCNEPQSPSQHSVHVFSPCPHDKMCPRFLEDSTPCNFETLYEAYNPWKQKLIKKERFSYVVLKKGPRAADNGQWPRIVRAVLPRSKHVVCRMCTPAGKLQEVIFTAAKHGKPMYKCAKSCKWGDRMPISLQEEDDPGTENT